MVYKERSGNNTVQEMKFSIKDFFSKCDKIRNFLRNPSHLLRKSLMENFIFCAVKPLLGGIGNSQTLLTTDYCFKSVKVYGYKKLLAFPSN